ncbi:dicarboxylate/amino acid:cation symporter [Flavobacteriaceae bacterium S0825]|uniref:dicarboxylate/amino acid:cation symporter n=1 Tax=Gaetbulibacter sp. S0825 TaxID=2720084 RepID=UPI001431E2CB|nr:dicarboxylate/amino acid:cation symporter [Gaetbulibacter sp. S0825]MCK0109663.1 dicarboxylate/amino acid:cation symporter [Flavobacteriaceae bacterium S0825]NIX65296.1 dicarboxylate/amino acid:cation symporter [Gaetbulibacter sp. S0825]
MKKMALHWKILLGMLLGVIIGLVAIQFSWGQGFVTDWIKPIGQIFISLLKLIAVPLVIVSLSKGITDFKDLSDLSKIGGRTIGFYLFTTVLAVVLGLFLVNTFSPGSNVNPDALINLSEGFTASMSDKIASADVGDKGPLSFFVELVPQNMFSAFTNNASMLQVIFVTIFFSVCMLLIPSKHTKPVKKLIDSINRIMLKMVDVIMLTAPYAVAALIATLIAETTNAELFIALLRYAALLLFGMLLLVGVYVLLIMLYAKKSPKYFLKGILPAQLTALTTSSSMATLPVTMKCVEENLGVEQEISSFVCPVGATINMDATSLMQAIAAVFVCQVLGHDLTLTDQLTIVLTATLASIGAAATPSAGIIMLVIVLESVGFPSEKLAVALAMIMSVDRPLDMARTVVNISGDSCVCVLVAKSLKKLK